MANSAFQPWVQHSGRVNMGLTTGDVVYYNGIRGWVPAVITGVDNVDNPNQVSLWFGGNVVDFLYLTRAFKGTEVGEWQEDIPKED